MKISSWKQLLSAALHGYKKNSFILIPALVTILLSVFIQPFSGKNVFQYQYPFLTILIISVLIGIYIKAGMLGIVGKSWKGRAILSDCWKTANKKFFSLLGAEIIAIGIIGSIIIAGISSVSFVPSLLIIYGAVFVIAALFLSFTSYAVVLSGLQALEGIKESIRFVRKNFFSVVLFFIILFALLAPIMLAVLALEFASTANLIDKTVSTFLISVTMWLVAPYFIFLQGYFYLAKKKKRIG